MVGCSPICICQLKYLSFKCETLSWKSSNVFYVPRVWLVHIGLNQHTWHRSPARLPISSASQWGRVPWGGPHPCPHLQSHRHPSFCSCSLPAPCKCIKVLTNLIFSMFEHNISPIKTSFFAVIMFNLTVCFRIEILLCGSWCDTTAYSI